VSRGLTGDERSLAAHLPSAYLPRAEVLREETRPMDVLNKVNLLAVCAAFVFVGAIVLGAF
jgi:hypothetical protein